MNLRPSLSLLLAFAVISSLSGMAYAQSLADTGDAPEFAASTAPSSEVVYTRPTQQLKLRNYFFDAFGPYPIVGAAAVAGIGQMENTTPAWGQGAAGYSRRFGSDLGIAAISTTTRYGLAEVLKEDTLYYRCECKGVLPRLGHVVLSTFTARHGEDGRRAFSYSAFAAPYVGTITADYAWYPGGFNTRYALRMGNLNLLATVGQNFMMEFFYSGPHSLLTRMHLDNPHAAVEPEPAK
jgi:hypothetical protein